MSMLYKGLILLYLAFEDIITILDTTVTLNGLNQSTLLNLTKQQCSHNQRLNKILIELKSLNLQFSFKKRTFLHSIYAKFFKPQQIIQFPPRTICET